MVDNNVNGGNNNLSTITVNKLTEHPPSARHFLVVVTAADSLCFGEARSLYSQWTER